MNYSIASGAKFKAPAVEGYTFSGWTVAGGTEGTDYTVDGANVTILKNAASGMVFTANYESNKYKIVLVPNASNVYESGSSTPVNTKGTEYSKGAEIEYASHASFDAPAWTREGYTLVGFSAKKSAKTFADLVTSVGGQKADKKGVVTFYAIWALNKYGITYSTEGIVRDGEGEKNIDLAYTYSKMKLTDSCAFGKTVSLPSKVDHSGYTFLGWELQSSSDQTDVATNSKGYVTKIGPKNKASVVVVPIFGENTYTLKINPNGGEVNGNKKTYTLGTFKYSDDVKSAIEKEFGDRVLEDCYNNRSAFDDSKEKRVGYNFRRVALSANGKSTIYSGYYLGGNSNLITWVKYLSPKDKGTVTLYAVWSKVSAPSYAPVVKPILSSGTLYANADESYDHMQVQYSTDPKFKKNVITVDKERVYSDDNELDYEYYEDFNTIETDLTGNVYYVRARNANIDSTGNFVFGSWSNIERASKTTDLPTTP